MGAYSAAPGSPQPIISIMTNETEANESDPYWYMRGGLDEDQIDLDDLNDLRLIFDKQKKER